MKLGKAIEILTQMGTPEFRGHTEDILAARKLGVEALKRIQLYRADYFSLADHLLPGETEE